MKQDAAYAIERSQPPPEPADTKVEKKKKSKLRKKPLVVKDEPKPTDQAENPPPKEAIKALGGKTKSVDFSDLKLESQRIDSQSYPQSKLD